MTLYRKAEREAFCRYCDKKINKGDYMISWYSYRNRGMYIHLHPECVKEMALLGDAEKEALKEVNSDI